MNIRRFCFFLYLCFLSHAAFCFESSTVYVSSSIGADSNDGSDINHPMRDLRKAVEKGNEILLKAGDWFYVGNLSLQGKKMSRYGDGQNPTICGYKRIVEPHWEEVEGNIWRLSLVEGNFSGIVLNGSSLSNNICAFHDFQSDKIHGRKVWHRSEMMHNWDFWQTEALTKAQPNEYDYVYLYLTSNPNQMKLEMSIYDVALKMNQSIVDGINFIGFGFGISAGTNTEIRNCKIDAIGGRIIREGKSYICYGNGIEFGVRGATNIENCIVEDCYVSRCYDCGITIQGSGGTTATPRNVVIRNNLITNCCQGWEDFLRNNEDVVYENCVFENNIVLRSGNTTGFGYAPSRFKFCHVLGNNVLGDKGMRIENNTFADGNFYCSGTYNGCYKSNRWKGNKCYIAEGYYLLGEYFGRRDILRMSDSKRKSKNEIQRYQNLTGDTTTVFELLSSKKMYAKTKSLERTFLKRHSY